MKSDLSLIVLENCKELGEKVAKHLNKIRKTKTDYITPIEEVKFGDGTGKIVIKKSVRDKQLFILTDVENPCCTYELYGYKNYKSPDDHFADLRRVISAISGHTRDISVYMPFLYSSRQHRGKNYESNDCADALKDLSSSGVKAIITNDAHDEGVKHSLVRTSTEFQNIFVTNYIVKDFLENEKIDLNDLIIISPDEGAMKRAKYYAGVFKTNLGFCYKLRDLSKVVNGKNPILEHVYIGPKLKNKNIIIIDDMIASGASILDTARLIKEQGAKNIYLFATFALFTEGIELFQEKHKEGLFTKIYSTNLTNNYTRAKDEPWFHAVDCSYMIAEIIDIISTHKSLSCIINIKPEILEEIENRKKISNN